MDRETVFRTLFALAFVAMMAIRAAYQSRVLRDKRRVEMREGGLSLVAGAIAALTSIVFGAEYLFFPRSFWFAYVLHYPDWLRWLGGLLLAVGIALLWLSHRHLGSSFHSFVVSKEDQVLVQSGPLTAEELPDRFTAGESSSRAQRSGEPLEPGPRIQDLDQALGSTTRPTNRIAPDSMSRIKNRNG